MTVASVVPSAGSLFRCGLGVDAHRLGGAPPLKLGGVTVDETNGVRATSDGDLAAHAVADGLLGTANLGDLGTWFPSDELAQQNADSRQMLAQLVREAAAVGVVPYFVDLTIIAQQIRIAPFRAQIAAGLAQPLGLDPAQVSVKATSTDELGLIGAGEGIAVYAMVNVSLTEPSD